MRPAGFVSGVIPWVARQLGVGVESCRGLGQMVTELVSRFAALGGYGSDLTLVFAAGQNSAGNVELLAASPPHFVGSLPPSDHPDLLAVDAERYATVDDARLVGLRAFEVTKVVFGVERRLVRCHSDGLHTKQSQSFDQTLAKARRQLSEFAARLARGLGRKPRAKVEAAVAQILRPRWPSRVISTTLVGDTPRHPPPHVPDQIQGQSRPGNRDLRERILFSDHPTQTATSATIVGEYRSQEAAEGDFRQMKDPKSCPSRPCSTGPNRRSGSTSPAASSP
jgi:hypothetical protein